MEQRVRPKGFFARLTACIAVGGLGMAIIMCFLIGFGLNSVVGKEAVYICLFLQALNLLVLHLQERTMLRKELAPVPSKRMRILRKIFVCFWSSGALLLLLSLGLVVFGLPMGEFWVKLTCYAGTAFALLGWFGQLIAFQRLKQSALVQMQRQGAHA